MCIAGKVAYVYSISQLSGKTEVQLERGTVYSNMTNQVEITGKLHAGPCRVYLVDCINILHCLSHGQFMTITI